MFNLLPETHRKNIRREYLMRLFVVVLLFFAATIIVILVLFLSSFISLVAKEKSAYEQLAIVTKNFSIKEETLRGDLTETQKKLNALSVPGQSILIYRDLFDVIIDKKGPISITGFFYEKRGIEHIVRVQGIANSRETLLTFINNLKEEPTFTEVRAPVSSFVKDKDIEFVIEVFVEI